MMDAQQALVEGWPKKCELCPAMFRDSCHAREHATIHVETPARKFRCSPCCSFFLRLADLSRHGNLYHNRERGRTKREHCNKPVTRGTIDSHMRTHLNVSCPSRGSTNQSIQVADSEDSENAVLPNQDDDDDTGDTKLKTEFRESLVDDDEEPSVDDGIHSAPPILPPPVPQFIGDFEEPILNGLKVDDHDDVQSTPHGFPLVGDMQPIAMVVDEEVIPSICSLQFLEHAVVGNVESMPDGLEVGEGAHPSSSLLQLGSTAIEPISNAMAVDDETETQPSSSRQMITFSISKSKVEDASMSNTKVILDRPVLSYSASVHFHYVATSCLNQDDSTRKTCHEFLETSPSVALMIPDLITFLHDAVIDLFGLKCALLVLRKLLNNPHVTPTMVDLGKDICIMYSRFVNADTICKCTRRVNGTIGRAGRVEFERHMEVRKLASEVVGRMVFMYSTNENKLRGYIRDFYLTTLYADFQFVESIVGSMFGLLAMFEHLDITMGIPYFGGCIPMIWHRTLLPECRPYLIRMIEYIIQQVFNVDLSNEEDFARTTARLGPAIVKFLSPRPPPTDSDIQ